MIKGTKKVNVLKVWYIVYLFIAVFQPPIIPIPLIYVFGILTMMLLIKVYNGKIRTNIIFYSGLNNLIKLFFLMLLYLLFIGFLNSFTTPYDLTNNRMRCINQLIVLSIIQFIGIWYVIILSKKLQYKLEDVFERLIFIGVLQGICSAFAYISPVIRSLFIRYADQNLFTNKFFVERRGYGFSGTLIDTFGYGMGLLGGYLLLSDLSKNKTKKIIWLGLIFFSIFMNARTGLVVLAIAFILKILQSDRMLYQIGKIIVAIPLLYIIIFMIMPKLIEVGISSNNITINWVMKDIQELYNTLLYGKQNGISLADASFFSNFGNLPTNIFEFIFGSGHSIYDTKNILGFRTDVGYINLLWEFGLMGSIILLSGIFIWMIRPLKKIKNKFIRSIILLNVISYAIVMLKAILIGYNPGVFINYISTAFIYYYMKVNNISYDMLNEYKSFENSEVEK